MLTYVDITDLNDKANMLERLATTDPLTGCTTAGICWVRSMRNGAASSATTARSPS